METSSGYAIRNQNANFDRKYDLFDSKEAFFTSFYSKCKVLPKN